MNFDFMPKTIKLFPAIVKFCYENTKMNAHFFDSSSELNVKMSKGCYLTGETPQHWSANEDSFCPQS